MQGQLCTALHLHSPAWVVPCSTRRTVALRQGLFLSWAVAFESLCLSHDSKLEP